MKFRKKPVIVEAEQFLGGDAPVPFASRGQPIVFMTPDKRFAVLTIHGDTIRLEPGDWVILESRGWNNAYACKPDIFASTYEKVDDDEAFAAKVDGLFETTKDIDEY